MSTESVEIQDSGDGKKSAFQEQLEALEIPAHIDPRLLALWLEREREELEKSQKEPNASRSKSRQGRKLTRLFAACVGVMALCVVIVLGLLQGKESGEILIGACKTFLFYTILGFCAGWIAESCVRDSVETMLREIIRRSDEAAQKSENTPNSSTESLQPEPET